ncbi:GNAT family N-acetyltransferase [Paeniroseomonas aquatica]|uniref:GNAT family N-acetyltransferase n=1 Tax=Paeniroseomonas aquatica TaxID=373043 RepID=A0ABT8A078_9PROT|nr:GNAT family N-acetyltransferase [Paeniroseomonas aquatica]MDN3563127.1 GNAT family N-acetyltransferase [Paeniroseomonas aquatica]
MQPLLTLTDTPDPSVRQAIVRPLIRFNEAQSGRCEEFRPLAILITDVHTGEIVGGLWGGTNFTQLHIDLLFVPEDLRGSGIGSRIMHDAEAEALRRECRGVWLDTYSFQARGFYERLGYSVFGMIEDYLPGHTRFFLKKSF